MASEAVDWVAEHIMSFERGQCAGHIGCGSVTNNLIDGLGFHCISGFYCDSCGQRVDWSAVGPCSGYRFPAFTLVDLMRRLGEAGISLVVRFDTQRERNRFTVIGPEGRICDTDDPLEGLCQYLMREYDAGDEPEDEWLVNSGILEKLVEEALQESPSEDWEVELRNI